MSTHYTDLAAAIDSGVYANPTHAFCEERTHEAFAFYLRNDRAFAEVAIDEALRKLPVHARLIMAATDRTHRTYVLASIHDAVTGAIESYASWLVCPSRKPERQADEILNPWVSLESGRYRIPTLTEGVAILSERVGRTV